MKYGVVMSIGAFLAAVASFFGMGPSAVALPSGRHYEMVSEVYKAGYGVASEILVAPDGESVGYFSPGSFAGAPQSHFGRDTYVAKRSASGWSTSPLMLPAAVAPYGKEPIMDISSNFGESLFYGVPAPNAGYGQHGATESEYLLHDTGAPDTAPEAPEPGPFFEACGEVLKVPAGHEDENIMYYEGASATLSHVVFIPEPGVALTREGEGLTSRSETGPYDLACHSGSEGALRFIPVNNKPNPRPIDPECEGAIGAIGNGHGGEGSQFNAIAAGGEEIFFFNGVEAGSNGAECDEHEQLFVRLGGQRTLEVSRPLEPCGSRGEVPCPGAQSRPWAEFAGASEDGTRVYFMTSAPLEPNTDKDSGNDLYVASIECPGGGTGCPVAQREVGSLVQVSHDPNTGEAANVQGVVALSPDGSRAYFVARGVLLSGAQRQVLESEGRPVPVAGADNLYVYEPDPAGEGPQHVEFIAGLCTGEARSGEVEDRHCPDRRIANDTGLWGAEEKRKHEVDTAGADARFLVFSSYGQLTGDDADNAKDIYRYDAQSGVLARVSTGEEGYAEDGNGYDEGEGSNADARIPETPLSEYARVFVSSRFGTRAVSEDGSRIVFRTAEPLSPDAASGLVNAYEWDEGKISLLGTGSAAIETAVISPQGNDIFFVTAQRLLSQDSDEAPDVYDARYGPGFPPESSAAEECSADSCQGPLTNPAPLLVPASVVQASGEYFQQAGKPFGKAKVAKRKRRRCADRTKRHKRCRAARAPARRRHRRRKKGGRS